MSGAEFRADVLGVGPTVLLKQMYYRHRLDFSCALDQLTFPPFTIFPRFKKKMQKINAFLCIITPRLSARCSFRCGFFFSSFSHPPIHFPQCCFCFFLAVHTNICFVRVTSHIPNHRESCSQRQQTGPTLRVSPGWLASSRDRISHVLIKISKVVTLHLPWLSGATIQTTYTKRPHFFSHEHLLLPPNAGK